MRFAYADPPYPGQSADLYADHPNYAGEVDHGELIGRLCRDYPDGWILSTSARALRLVLPLCPEDVWTGAWHKTNAPPVRTTGRRIWSWEPVIIWRGRQEPGSSPNVRDSLSCSQGTPGHGQGFPGQKPPAFIRWIAELLGATPDDTIDDLFPGSGAVTVVLADIKNQPTLEQLTLDGQPAKRNRRYAGLPGSKSHRVI
jgi:hypothetical protein